MEFQSCFDSLLVAEVINDLYESGVTDDQLDLIEKLKETKSYKS